MSAQTVDVATVEQDSPPAQITQAEWDSLLLCTREVHAFAGKLAATLDAMMGNPMIAAMMPPGLIPDSE